MDFFLCGKPKPNPDFSSLHGKKSLFMLNFSFSDIWDWFCHQILSGEGEKPGNFVCPEEQTVRLEIYSRLFPDCSDSFHTSCLIQQLDPGWREFLTGKGDTWTFSFLFSHTKSDLEFLVAAQSHPQRSQKTSQHPRFADLPLGTCELYL